MFNINKILLFIFILFFLPNKTINLREKRERIAFDLLRLEHQLKLLNNQNEHLIIKEDKEESCHQKCNEQLRMGLDMVKSHSSFGSIGVPSVIDKSDLQLFCNLDLSHDNCLIECGFQVQFNMRDFVCNSRNEELISHLNCYSNAALNLKRNCGSLRCGPYNELKLTFIGMSQRCKTILCDLNCVQKILNKEPSCRENGKPAIEYLIKYSQFQVFYWLKEIFNDNKISNLKKWPRNCSKLICENNKKINNEENNNCSLPNN